ncbi:MAG: hypothetical protein ABJE10_14430 [bacterium]
MTRAIVFSALLVAVASSRISAQEHAHGADDKLGSVHFATSCSPAVATDFDRGIALLHSFEFGASIRTFNTILERDSTCAMAHWGIALSRWTNPMSTANRPSAQLALGRGAAVSALRLSQKATERERGYAAAVNELYADYEHRDQHSRIVAYEHAMADLAAAQPADTEAKIFYALSLAASAPPTDKTYANQLKAGAILESLWVKQPNHPGLAHYIIHSYDVPALASHASDAAQRYADIAPAAAHALHMPSHTFTRVGQWQESVNTNARSVEAAKREGAVSEALHASDYMEYAFLQMRRDSEAKAIVDGLPALAAKFNPNAVTGAAPGSAGVFALAAIPARYALERRQWSEAAALVPTSTSFPYADALTYFARALGAAHLGDLAGARASADTLIAIHSRLMTQNESYWGEQVAIQEIAARAWIAFAEHNVNDALTRMREATAREDATEKGAITPGPLAPARELLADMLLEVGQPAEALVEYRKTLTREPNRYRTLFGATRAAASAKDKTAEAQYSAQLRALVGIR